MKIKFLVLALLAIFLAAGTAFAQLGADQAGFDITQLIGQETGNLLNAPTGKMTDEIALEVVARISVCHQGKIISEEEFKILKAPYSITTVEFAAYYLQRLSSGGQGASQFLEKWASRMPGLVAAVTAKGCKFAASAEPAAPEQCQGYCAAGKACPSGTIDKGSTGCQPQKQCHSCGFLGLRKCCDYLPATCCEYPKPVNDCRAGLCTYDDCPEGTQAVGSADCEEAEDCKPCWWGLLKCCQKKQTQCCLTINNTKCKAGTCQNSATCSKGFKSIGMADCGSYENIYGCGFLGHVQCQEPAPKTCCVPD